MKIPLSQFEQVIDEVILKRGLNYFKKGFVKDFTEISYGEYEASVSGTEMYLVQMEIKNNTIVSHNCDCPYDMGAVCKHVVAAIFYHQQEVLDLNSLPKKPRAKRGTGKKTTAQLVKEIFKKVSREELEQFIKDNIKGNRQFRTLFLASFAHLNQNQSRKFYREQIKPIIKAAADRDGWITPANMRKLDKALTPFWNTADKFVATQNYTNAIQIHTAMVEEMVDAQRNYLEEYEVSIDELIEHSAERLVEIASMELPNEIRIDFIDYCIDLFKSRILADTRYNLSPLLIAYHLVRDQYEVDILIKYLDSVEQNNGKSQAQRFILNLLDKFKSEEEKKAFVKENLSNPAIRLQEIVNALESENYKRAERLARAGLTASPEMEVTWYDFLLKTAQAQENVPQILLYARSLFVNAYYFEKEYFLILKKTIKDELWEHYLEKIIEDIKKRNYWGGIKIEREIYIQEEDWVKLFDYLKQDLSLERLAENEKYLVQDYRDELIQFYNTGVMNYLDKHMGRPAYKKACRYLRRMKKLGGDDDVKMLIQFFEEVYSKRSALMEELRQV